MNKWPKEIDGDPSGLSCYYIAKRNTVLSRISGTCDVNVSTLQLGMLVQVNEVQADGGLRIRVNDTSSEDIWRKTEWRCHKRDLISVPTIVWHFLAAISIPQERVNLASNDRLCQEAKNFKHDDRVWFQSHSCGEKISLAIIKYIGPVPELGQGFYFGLELLESLESTQTSALARRYITHGSGNVTLATLSEVRPLELELSEKSSDVENVALPNDYYFDGMLNSTSNNHMTNGKRIQSDFTVAFDERCNIFGDRNNNNGDTVSNLSNALIPKVAHKSVKSKIVMNDASAIISRNHDSFDFLGNNNQTKF